MSSFVRYTANGSQTTFPITFPFLRVEHVLVYVNGVQSSWTESNGSVVLSPAPTAGAEVIVRRVTPASPILVTFSLDNQTSPTALNEAYLQALFAAEDTAETVENLNLTLGADQVPLAVAADRLLVSRPIVDGFQWQAVEASEVIPLVTGIPLPTAGFKVLGADEATADYRFYTAAELAAYLGGSSTVPAPTTPNTVLMTNAGGTAYVLTTVTQLSSLLGLGTASKKNVGTAQGQIPELGPVVGGVGSMPAVHVGDMIGVAPEPDYALFAVTLGSAVACPNNKNLTEGGSITQGPNSGAWISPSTGAPAPGFLLQPGKYKIEFEAQFPNPSGSSLSIDIVTTGGVASPSSLTGLQAFAPEYHSVRGYLTVTAATNVSLRARLTSGSTQYRVSKAHIWKLA